MACTILPFPPPGDLPNPRIELSSVSPLSPLGIPAKTSTYSKKYEERIDQSTERKFMHKQNTEKEEDLRIVVDMTLEKLKIDCEVDFCYVI